MACSEALEEEMRGLRIHEIASSASHKPRLYEQRAGEHPDAMQALSRLLAHHGPASWKDGSWEDGIPRVTNGMAHRAHRIKAIGNGQVPRVRAAAWEIIHG